MGVEHDSGWPAQAALAARDEQVDGVGDRVAQLEQREGALVGEHRALRADGEPLLVHLVVLGAREALQSEEPATHWFVTAPAHVMVQQLAADSMPARLSRGEVAMLLVGVR